VVSSAETFRRASIDASLYRARASRQPVCAASPLAVGASTPAEGVRKPLQSGFRLL